MTNKNKMINNWYDGVVNMGFLRILCPLWNLLFERNLLSVIFVSSVMRLTNMAFAPWRVGLENNTRDVMARQAEGLV